MKPGLLRAIFLIFLSKEQQEIPGIVWGSKRQGSTYPRASDRNSLTYLVKGGSSIIRDLNLFFLMFG